MVAEPGEMPSDDANTLSGWESRLTYLQGTGERKEDLDSYVNRLRTPNEAVLRPALRGLHEPVMTVRIKEASLLERKQCYASMQIPMIHQMQMKLKEVKSAKAISGDKKTNVRTG